MTFQEETIIAEWGGGQLGTRKNSFMSSCSHSANLFVCPIPLGWVGTSFQPHYACSPSDEGEGEGHQYIARTSMGEADEIDSAPKPFSIFLFFPPPMRLVSGPRYGT